MLLNQTLIGNGRFFIRVNKYFELSFKSSIIFQENSSLKAMDLSWNGFGNDGALAIGEALKENSSLIELDLRLVIALIMCSLVFIKSFVVSVQCKSDIDIGVSSRTFQLMPILSKILSLLLSAV